MASESNVTPTYPHYFQWTIHKLDFDKFDTLLLVFQGSHSGCFGHSFYPGTDCDGGGDKGVVLLNPGR